ncbi:hypothetical protein EUV02_09740 [Polymorphobacter arshaanensis]|uniref:Novel STAND NTPase 1 domain-containing protein n=1 Tax=Glacieibacterium arshaanense TaxID=2511025 RepID=A0A4Y9EN20_9SPHN|nr:hypothetical protein [Polymorphobacter arshaanensis]TFU03442.1 hypothetical protein EUV02_09740 [Polymorphobacter arshaanensis]
MSDEAVRRNPYVGLRPFFKADSLYFFGRDAQVEELLAILGNNRFLGVVGSSGSGKSSLVRAGLVPALLGGFLVHDRDRWRRVSIKPGDAPMANLAAGLVAAMSDDPDAEAHSGSPAAQSLEAALRAGHTPAALDYIRPRLEPNANLFVLVDQFEELFAFRGDDDSDDQPDADPERRKERARRKAEASDFVDLLLTLADQRELPVYVVLTMRTDFLGDCDLFFGLPEALNRGRYLVPRMTREQLRDAVECPALLAGAEVAPRLLDHVLNALGDRFDRLPVLQHALMRTWDAWLAEGATGPVDLRHFDSAGGLEGALNKDAEAALVGLDLVAVERIFKRLTDTDSSGRRIRSPARTSELAAAAGVDRTAVEAIMTRYEADGRSFVHPSPDGRPDDPRYDISHESLIRQWVRLRDWVDEERKSRDSYVELVDRAARYARKDADPLQGPELRLARDWNKAAKPSEGWAARYSKHDGDFAAAMRYLTRSVRGMYAWRAARVGLVAGTVLFLSISAYKLQETIKKATTQNSEMVASVYRKLDPIDGTAAARKDLLKRTSDLNRDLANGNLTDSNKFWQMIVTGDDHGSNAIDKNAAILDAQTAADADAGTNEQIIKLTDEMHAETNQAAKSYSGAADFARARAIETHDFSWFENLGTALTKYAEIAASDRADTVYQAVIAVDRYLVAKQPANKSYLFNLATGYRAWGDWLSADQPDAPEKAKAKYQLAESTARQLLAKDANSVEAMSLYIDIATALWSVIDPEKDAELDKRITDEMTTQANRRIAVDKIKKQQWTDARDALYDMLGIEKPKAEGRPAKRGSGGAVHMAEPIS